MKKEITIIGAGLVGSLLSIYLKKRGYHVTIYERRGDMRKATVAAGRSINLALSDRGIKALEEVGIMEEVKRIAIPMHGRYIHNADGSNAYQAYGAEGQFINSVSRGDLNRKLIDLAEANGVQINFNEKCDHIDFKKNEIHFINEVSQHLTTHQSLLTFGSDGSYSAARLTHQLQHNRFQYQQHYIDFGYKELTIPAGANGEYLLDKNALHIWPRGNYMMIALPNMDGSFTCTLFFPFEGEPSFNTLTTKEKVKLFFENTFTNVASLMPTLEEDFFTNPTSSLVTVKCFPWIRDDKFALIGDAAHAIVPFFGQGMNCGFEDCTIFGEMLDAANGNWDGLLSAYSKERVPDGNAIIDLSLRNYVEMRDLTGNKEWLLRKKIESKFNDLHPDKWLPLYSQVTFSHIRYNKVVQNGVEQDAIMEQVMKLPNIEEKWDSQEVMDKMLSLV